MRIDDKNKTIWMNESIPDELMLKLKKYNYISKLAELSKISGKFGMPIAQNDRDWSDITFAVFNGYKFESENNKKYYWRKKNEHSAWFEEERYLTSFKFSDNENYCYVLGSKNGSLKKTEKQARDILKDDFDKFEKVEIEESKQ